MIIFDRFQKNILGKSYGKLLTLCKITHIYREQTGKMTIKRMVFFMIWTLLIVLFGLWFIGFSFKIIGGAIHLLLVIILVIIIYQIAYQARLRD